MYRTRRSPAAVRVLREGVGREGQGQGDVDLKGRRGLSVLEGGDSYRLRRVGSSSSSASVDNTSTRSRPNHSTFILLLLVLAILTLLPSAVVGSPLPLPDDPFLISPPDPAPQPDESPTTTTAFDWWPYGEKTMTKATEGAAPTTMVGSDEDASTTTEDAFSSMLTSSAQPSHHSSAISPSSSSNSATSTEESSSSSESASASVVASTRQPVKFKILYLTPVFAVAGESFCLLSVSSSPLLISLSFLAPALALVALGLCLFWRRRPSSNDEDDDEYPGLRERFRPPLQDRGQYAYSGEKRKSKGEWDSENEEETDDFDFGYGIRGMAAGRGSFNPSQFSSYASHFTQDTVADGGGYVTKPSKKGSRGQERSWLRRSKTNIAGVGGRWGRVELRDDSFPIDEREEEDLPDLPRRTMQAVISPPARSYAGIDYDTDSGEVGLGIGGLPVVPRATTSSSGLHPSSMVSSPPNGMLSPPFQPHLFYASSDSASRPSKDAASPYTALPPRSSASRPLGGRALTRSNPSKNLATSSSPIKPNASSSPSGSRPPRTKSSSSHKSHKSSSSTRRHRRGPSASPLPPPSILEEGSEYGTYPEDEPNEEETAAMMNQVDQILKKSLSDRALLSPQSLDIASPPPPAILSPSQDEDERIGRRDQPAAGGGIRAVGGGAKASPARDRPKGGVPLGGDGKVGQIAKRWPPAPSGSPGIDEGGLGIEQRLARLRKLEFGE